MPSHDDDASRRYDVVVIGAGSGLTGAPVAGRSFPGLGRLR
jgi:hypothetical protein